MDWAALRATARSTSRSCVTELHAGAVENVVANPGFGFQVSAEGSGCTWAGNSRDNRLTPWSNDPVGDQPGEAIYLRDDDSGELFGPTALPIRHETGVHVVRHGRGYSRFEHARHGIALDLLQFVPTDESIKMSRLRPEPVRSDPSPDRDCLRRMGTRHVAHRNRTVRNDGDRYRDRRHVRAQPASGADARVAFIDLRGRQTA